MAPLIYSLRQGGRVRGAILALLALLCLFAATAAGAALPAGPGATRIAAAAGRIVPIPASVPHEPGDMVDSRLVKDLRWLAERFPIYVTEGYSGPLPGGGRAGCKGCHVENSDHHNGLAVDIVPRRWSARCDANWRGITRLALWAEPRQNRPRPPFRWVGYNGDRGHGCGHHLHLSWNHAPVKEFRVAAWVEVFTGRRTASGSTRSTPRGPSGGVLPGGGAGGGGIGPGD